MGRGHPQQGLLRPAEREENFPTQGVLSIGLQHHPAASPGLLPRCHLQNVVQRRQNGTDLFRRGLRGQLHGGGAGKPFLQVLRRVTGHQPSLGEDEDGLTHRLHLG